MAFKKTSTALAVKQLWNDLETFSPTPIKSGTHRYAEDAEVMIWAYALDDDTVYVWDIVNSRLHWRDLVSGVWLDEPVLEGCLPADLAAAIKDESYEVWFQNGGMFDFVVLAQAMPEVLARISLNRWRDTMVQAFSHALPGSLDKLGSALGLADGDKKDTRGKALIRLFCMPQSDDFAKTYGTNRASKATHPKEWQELIEYAGGDIVTMRAVHKAVPKWNLTPKQIALWHTDLVINSRGFMIDVEMATAAIEAVERIQARLRHRTQEITEGQVSSATRREQMLRYILAEYGVDLPDMRADTLERRLEDPDLPEPVRELIKIRLVASMNSTSKYKTALKAANTDGRIRGGAQFRGAGRTGRYAHRLFQHGNMPRPTVPQSLIEAGIDMAKTDVDEMLLILGYEIMQWASSSIRSCIIAAPGKKLAVADLSNIEGRVAAWLAGEDWKLQAFRDFDNKVGPDLYILAYAKSFNVPVHLVPKKGQERQIGKVQELMLQYQGGVGAFLTGAATYGIDLDAMSAQVYPTLPQWAVEEAMDFLTYKMDEAKTWHAKATAKLQRQLDKGLEVLTSFEEIDTKLQEKLTGARMGLAYQTFVTCDAIKRLWRAAHPKITGYWKQIDETIHRAYDNPKTTFMCGKIGVRYTGSWLRVILPSGRNLTYPAFQIDDNGFSYMGPNTYSRKWERVRSYAGKFFENWVQAVAADQLVECFPLIEEAGFEIIFHVHDETATEVPVERKDLTHEKLAELMCADLGWNQGLPLAAAGFSGPRYRKD
jgi:DNA polymerase